MTVGILTGCQQSEESNKTTVTQNGVQDVIQESFQEQGFEITAFKAYDENTNVVTLDNDGNKYFGTIDNNFEWLMEPTSEFNSYLNAVNKDTIVFSEGLAAVSIPDTRKMRLNDNLWGYINVKGEWVIEPIYREVNDFSNELAVVKTVEEDRDDLSNYRKITIDHTGNEVAQLCKGGKCNSFNAADHYRGNYLFESDYYDAFDKEGKYINLPNITNREIDDRFIIGDRIIHHKEYNNANDTLIISNFKGEILNDSLLDNDDINEFYYDETLAKNNLFQLDLIEGKSTIYNTDGVAIITAQSETLDTGFAKDLIFDYEHGKGTGTFYDFTGNEVYKVKKMVGPLFGNNRYFVMGKEYYKLVDVEGNVLIDESMKITYTDAKNFNRYFDDPTVKLVMIKYRENAEDTEPNEALLNIETLEIIDYEDLLKG